MASVYMCSRNSAETIGGQAVQMNVYKFTDSASWTARRRRVYIRRVWFLPVGRKDFLSSWEISLAPTNTLQRSTGPLPADQDFLTCSCSTTQNLNLCSCINMTFVQLKVHFVGVFFHQRSFDFELNLLSFGLSEKRLGLYRSETFHGEKPCYRGSFKCYGSICPRFLLANRL